MIDTVKKYIEQHHMFPPGCHVIIGLSGGADSVCLLRVLYHLKDELSIRLEAVHVHHGLRGAEADRDAEFSEELCRSQQIPCRVISCDMNAYAAEHGLSPEEAGRRLRYEAFEEAVRDSETREGVMAQEIEARIAVAHHRDDDVETVLHNLFRGSGLKGLGGIQPVREGGIGGIGGKSSSLTFGGMGYCIVRPLLCVGREEILSWLAEQGQPFCMDSTNHENDYTRNRIRNQIIPLAVSGVNENAQGNIVHSAMLIRQADAYIENKASEYLLEHAVREPGRLGIGAGGLRSQDPIIQSYVLMRMIEEMCSSRKDITSVHIDKVQELLEKHVGKSWSLPYGLTAVRDYENLWIESGMRISPDKMENPHFPVEMTVFSYEKGAKFPKNQYTKWFDYDKIKGTLSVRTRQTGDYILLPSGGKKTVKAYMIDEKIPSQVRDRILLLADGSHILWIIGYRISEYYKITDETDTILQVQYEGETPAAGKDKRNGGKDNGR